VVVEKDLLVTVLIEELLAKLGARVDGVVDCTDSTDTCLLHSMSRTWGIRLNNFLGTVKLGMLLCMILFGFIWLGKDNSVAAVNFDAQTSFSTKNSPKGVYRYAEATIFAIFHFGGFHQANYVSPLSAPPAETT